MSAGPTPTPEQLREALATIERALLARAPAPPPPTQPARLVTIAEAAERLGVSVKTIKRRIAAGEIPSQLVGARSRRIRTTDLDLIVGATDTDR
jgi:excisionase family DNA binding protein